MTDDAHARRSPVHRLYDAFRAGDGDEMQACYAADATFRDPVFDLRGAEEIGAMWKMLIAGGTDLVVEVGEIEADASTGRARWEARYTFAATGREVHNVIDAAFTLRDDRIVDHVDSFGFWRWARQALGPVGLVAGWTPMVRRQVRTTARRALERSRS
jgi:ketosteroid isomerase-like protein